LIFDRDKFFLGLQWYPPCRKSWTVEFKFSGPDLDKVPKVRAWPSAEWQSL